MAHWLRSRFFFPLVALSVVAMSQYLAWRQLIGPWNGPRLHLNLFLAWVPYFAALAAVALHQRRPNSPWLFRAMFVVWFFFFPNAPYLVTDWRYLPGWTDQLWYSLLMMTTFSLCGLFLAVISLYLMQTVVALRTSVAWGRAVVVAAIGLSGLGVYLGRFVRLNTWDLITHPRTVFVDVFHTLRTHEPHLGPIGFTVLFTLIFAALYYLLLEVRHVHRSREELRVWNASRAAAENEPGPSTHETPTGRA